MTDVERYFAAVLAMKHGVELEMQQRPQRTEPQNLRLAITVAMSDHTALVELLIEKGVISASEYRKALADVMEREAQACRDRLGVDLA